MRLNHKSSHLNYAIKAVENSRQIVASRMRIISLQKALFGASNGSNKGVSLNVTDNVFRDNPRNFT